MVNNNLSSIHALRGLASLWVCWFHFSRGGDSYPTWELLRSTGINGWLGVDVFFVISGFIIPYILYKSSYGIKNFGSFILKRVIRIQPPFLVSIAIVLFLGYASTLSPLYRGDPFTVDFEKILLNASYLIPFSSYNWLNDVYWTLSIEVQYYLLLGLIFPLINKGSIWAMAIAFILMVVAFIFDQFVFKWFFLFFMGYLTFIYYEGLFKRVFVIALMVVAFVGCCYSLSIHQAVAGLFAVVFILFFRVDNPVLNFLGNISFSLYLIHIPIGGRVINLGSRFAHSEASQVALLIVALALSLLSAWVLYCLVEKPAQNLASAIKYRSTD